MAQKSDGREVFEGSVCSCSVDRKPERVAREFSVPPMTFVVHLDGWVCPTCGDIEFDQSALERVDVRIASALARSGVSSPDAFRFMRKAIGLRATDLADLLDVTAETVSRWERGKVGVDARALAVLGTLALEHADGRSDALQRLRAIRSGESTRAVRVEI